MTQHTHAVRFAELQGKWQTTSEVERTYRNELMRRYQHYMYAKRSERDRLDRLQAATSKACERFYTLLDQVSRRNWRSSVPCNWVRDSLTYDLAIETGQLPIVPSPSYGYTDADMRAFAWPLSDARE